VHSGRYSYSFIVYSSMDCLKRFRHKKPLLVGKLAVVCMQIALGDKTSVLETTLWFMQRKIAGVWGGGIAPPQKIFSILSLKMATFSAFWALAYVAMGTWTRPLDPPVLPPTDNIWDMVIVWRVRGETIWPALCCCASYLCTSYAHLYNEQFVHGRLDRALILHCLAVFRAPLCLRCTWCYM